MPYTKGIGAMQPVIFRKEREYYQRDTQVLKAYVNQSSFYLSRVKGISIEQARDFVIAGLKPGGAFEFKDPIVKFMHRENFADRELKETTMSKFLNDVSANNESLSPTFTSYCSPDVESSLMSMFTMDNIVKRDVIKGEMFDAQNAGDEVLYVFKNLGQNNAKTTNNSASGASLTPSTSLFNPTSHSTLTTNCRNTTAIGNTNNEKFIEGNRHYMNVDTILNNLISITTITDLNKVENVVREYGLYYPTAEDVLECIERSRLLYFRDKRYMGKVYEFVAKMKPVERAAFLYVGDLYHLWKHNKDFVVDLLNKLIQSNFTPLDVDTSDKVMKAFSTETINVSRLICRRFSAGKKPKEIKADNLENYGILAATAANVNNTLVGYQSLIDALWLTDNFPASSGNFPNSLRRSVLGGDTDSTLFTVQEWVQRVHGHIGFTEDMMATSDMVVYLAAETASHLHAKMSANYGMHPDRIFDTQMKNEYRFDIFVPTFMAKHYWAMKSAQEGNVYKKPQLELKGANMISSSVPGDIVTNVKSFLLEQMKDIVAGKEIRLDDLLETISEKENAIYDEVKSGKTKYFRTTQLNVAKSYKVKDPDRNPYWNHIFWQRTFGKVYGYTDEPPYSTTVVSLEISNVSEFATWIAGIENRQLADDIVAESSRIGRKYMTNVQVPVNIIQVSGIPKEILDASNARKIVRSSCSPYYHMLEAMGVFMANSKNTRMIYDLY